MPLVIASVNVSVTVAETLSVTLTEKVEVPMAVGVPLITPAPDRFSPLGSEPEVRDHVYGDVPPLATRVCEYGLLITPAGSVVIAIISLLAVILNSAPIWLPLS